jgi:hypothetical protein
MSLYKVVDGYRRFGETCCLHPQFRSDPIKEVLRNVGKHGLGQEYKWSMGSEGFEMEHLRREESK